MKNNFLFIFSLSIVVVSIFFSCKKKDTTVATGTFYLHIHSNIDTNEIDSKTTFYIDANGRRISINQANFYVSNIILQNTNGTTYSMTNTKIIKDLDSETYLMGTAPIGTYNAVKFDVGVDDATNALQPNSFVANGNVANASMWYGNIAQGYKFMNITGYADTTAGTMTGQIVPFYYAIGGSANRKTVSLPTRGAGSYSTYQPYTLTANGTNYIHLICDYGKLLSGIDFRTQDTTNSFTKNPAIATIIANQIPSIFSYEQ